MRKSFCVRVCCAPPESVSGEVTPLVAELAAALIEEVAILLVFFHAQVSQPAAAFTREAGWVNVPVMGLASPSSANASPG